MAQYHVTQSSTAYALVFLLTQSADHISALTGATATVTLSKNGAAFAAPSGAVTEIGSGWYKVAGNATDTNTLGPLLLHATATGADPTDVVYEIVAFDPQSATSLGLSRLDAAVSSRMATFTLPANFSSFSLNASGFVTVVTNNDKSGYALTQAFPVNFASMALTVGGAMTAGTVSDKTGYSLSATQAFNLTGNVTGNLTGSVGSVTGGVIVTTNNDKAGYSLTQAFPANFSAMAITAGGVVSNNTTQWNGTAVGTVPPDATFIRSGTAQAGAASTITLDAGASATNNLYNDATIFIRSGTGAGQTNIVTGYVGATKVATVANAWATNPDATSTFSILPTGPTNAADIWNVTATTYNVAGTMGNKLNGAASAGDPWTTALPGAYGAGTAGNILGNRLDVVVSGRMATFTLPTNFAALAITGGGAVTAADPWLTALPGVYGPGTAGKIVGTNLDTPVSTRQATMTLPPNFAALAITAGGAVTAGTVSDKAGYSLSASQSFNLLGNLTGNVTGSVGSVTGNVGGNVTGSVGSVTGLTVPANFATLAITAGGQVAIDGTSALTEAYPTLGGGLTLSNAMHTMVALWLNSSNAGTTVTLKKRDRTTTAKTATYDSATSPSSITEAT